MSFLQIQIPTQNQYIFTTASAGDIVMATANSNQKFVIGTLSNSLPELEVSKQLLTFYAPVSLSNNISVTGRVTALGGYCNLPVASTSQAGIVQLNGNVASGLSNQAPTSQALSNVYTLAVAASNKAFTPVINSQWAYGATSNIIYIGTTSNVGIGTATPLETFHVASGNARIDGALVATTYCNLPNASTTVQGIVQLTTSTSSGSTSLVPTASALSNVFALAVTASNKAYTPVVSSQWSYGATSNIVYIGQSSNVGIGTSNPTSSLHVVGGNARIEGIVIANTYSNLPVASTATEGIVQLSTSLNSGSSNQAATSLALSNVYALAVTASNRGYNLVSSQWTAASNVLYVGSGSNVGIGTSNPATGYSLHVKGNTYVEGNVALQNMLYSKFRVTQPDANNLPTSVVQLDTTGLSNETTGIKLYATDYIRFVTGASEVGRISSNGVATFNNITASNITLTSYSNLPVASTTSAGIVQLTTSVTSASNNLAPTASALSNVYSLAVAASNKAYSPIVSSQWSYGATSNIVYVGQGSNIGIGTSNPGAYSLYVKGDTAVEGGLSLSSKLRVSQFSLSSTMPLSTITDVTACNIYPAANGQGTIGSVSSKFNQVHANAIYAYSNAYKPGGGVWLDTSDQRLKINIESANIDKCYDIIKNLPLKNYEWRAEVRPDQVGQSVLGWIAQDVEEVLPKSVQTTNLHNISDCKVLDATNIYVNMYGALQKVMRVIEDQNQRINNLTERIAQLELNNA